MSEILKIRNFAGINRIDVVFKRLNVFIGPQASGKSITIKLAFFFKEIFSELVKAISKEENLNTFKSNQVDKFIKFFPTKSWNSGDFEITYQLYDDISICIKREDNKKPRIELSSNINNCISKTKRYYKSLLNESKNEENISFLKRRNLEEKLNQEFFKHINQENILFNGDQFFIPAGRSFFSNLQESIFSFLKENTILDPFLIEFGSNYEVFKNIFYRHTKESKNNCEEIISNILHSEYKREKNIDSLIHKDNRVVNLSNASSGQQEILPLLVILKVLIGDKIILGRRENTSSIYIEEPEAHLFPNAQKAIVRLLAKLCNTNKYQIFITTHSPYLLSSINNHFIAGSIEPEKLDRVCKVIDKSEILHASESTAYSLNNGNCENLISHDEGIILAEVLDNVSNEISNDFEELLNLKYEG